MAAPTEPWQLYRQPPSSSTWISDALVRDHNNTASSTLMTSESFLPLFLNTFTASAAVTSPEVSTEAAEVTAAVMTSAKRKAVTNNNSKRRKSRASKGTQTTFIAADAANFRRMVQQVTGGEQQQFGGGGGCCYSSVGSTNNIVKPEPQRASRSLPPSTLDTSAFMFDRQQQQKVAAVGPTVAEGLTYSSCFPTLESWKVM